MVLLGKSLWNTFFLLFCLKYNIHFIQCKQLWIVNGLTVLYFRNVLSQGFTGKTLKNCSSKQIKDPQKIGSLRKFLISFENWPIKRKTLGKYFIMYRVSDPHHCNADRAFHFNAHPDPAFHFNADPDPAPHEGDANLRPLAYRPSRPPLWAFTHLYGSNLSLQSSCILTLMRIRIQVFALMRIRVQLPKTMRTHADPDPTPWLCGPLSWPSSIKIEQVKDAIASFTYGSLRNLNRN